MRNAGFTLSELIVGLIIGAIIILTVGAISSIANSSYNNIRREAEVYNDIQYGFNLIERSLRSAQSGSVIVDTTNNRLTVGDFIFRMDDNNLDFIYVDTKGTSDPADDSNHVIVSGILPDLSNNPKFKVDPSLNRLYTVTLNGIKDRVTFNLSASAKRRN